MADGGGAGGLGGASGWGLEGSARQLAILGGISLLALILLAFCQVLPGDDDDSAPAGDGDVTATSTSTAMPSATSTVVADEPTASPTTAVASDDDARTTRVGNVELRLVEVRHPYDATQHSGINTATTRIDLEATGVGDGGGYFTAFELTLMDDGGDEHGASSCLDCPGNLDSLELAEGETGEGAAYFELPEGRSPYELIYRGSASGEEGRIPLR